MLAWPLYAEQKLNAFRLVRDYGLAVELSLDNEKDGWVSAEELENGVRCLMGDSKEGHKVRKRAEEMAEASSGTRRFVFLYIGTSSREVHALNYLHLSSILC
ncbi:hypothetical protein MRB53_007181 [Persea americana]|uniref:Uncharacterized protein n=1 Tax=Persea americana TaxID=3435 RepID=A0ACC2MJA5_PERAE|nr:hypothetical protein MRB53_007181 [Persea americana]